MILYAAGQSWLQLIDGNAQLVQPYPELQQSAVVIWDPANSVSGVIALEGNVRHAAALIERRIKSEGGIEGTAKVFIDQISLIGRGYQVLYTAVALHDWQRMLTWAESQPDHCLVYTSTRLLWRSVRPLVATVLHSANQFTFIGLLQGQIVHINTLAFSASHEDALLASQNLGERVRDEVARSFENGQAPELTVSWFSINADDTFLEVTGDNSQTFTSQARNLDLQAEFELISGITVTSQIEDFKQLKQLKQENPGSVAPGAFASLQALARLHQIRYALNTAANKWMFMADKTLSICALASALLAVGLFGISAIWLVQSSQTEEAVKKLGLREVAAAKNLALLQADSTTVQGLEEQLAFTEDLQRLGTGYDLAGVLLALKAASTEAIQILRVRTEDLLPDKNSAAQKSTAVDEASSQKFRSIIVDGMLTENSATSDSQILSTFVRALRDEGYQAESAETKGSSSPSISSRLFSYRLALSSSAHEVRP